MEAVAEGLWGLADYAEKRGEIGKALKCLEAICQSKSSFLPTVEVKTRLRIASLLLKHSHNVNEAKTHLERSQLLLNTIPSSFDLKFRTCSLLSQCYHLVGAIPPQKQILNKALELTQAVSAAAAVPAYQIAGKLWSCNFNSQLANALIIEGDYQNALFALESGFLSAAELYYPELQMFFATSILHVHLMQWGGKSLVEKALHTCDEVWESVPVDRREQCFGLFFYNDLLHIFYRLRICDYKNASQHVDRLDAAVKTHSEKAAQMQDLANELNALNQSLSRSDLSYRERSTLSAKQALLQECLGSIPGLASSGCLEPTYFGHAVRVQTDKLVLAPPPIDGEWLPKGACYALVDLMVVILGRPKGFFKECAKRIQSGIHAIQVELVKLGITNGTREVDLQHSAIWMAGVYLMLLMQFLENKVAVELTRAEFVEAQEALVQMKSLFIRFPTILQACESVIEMLRGQYAHSVGCYSEAAYHYVEAANLTESKSMQAMCQIYAAVSYFCIGDAESSSQALDLIGPIYRLKDTFVGVREEASVLFAYGLLLMKQQDLQEARYMQPSGYFVLLLGHKLELEDALHAELMSRLKSDQLSPKDLHYSIKYDLGNRLAKGLQIAHNNMGNLQLVSQYLTILGTLALALHDTSQAREILRSSLTLAKKLYDIPTQIWVLSVLTDLYQELGEEGNEMENDEYRMKKVDDLRRKLADAHSSIHHIELIDEVKVQVQQLNDIDIKRAMEGQSMRINLDIPESVGLSAPPPPPSSSRLVDLDARRRGKKKI